MQGEIERRTRNMTVAEIILIVAIGVACLAIGRFSAIPMPSPIGAHPTPELMPAPLPAPPLLPQ